MNDLFTYFDKLSEHEFLDEARNYWDDSYDEVVEEIKSYTKSDFKATGDRWRKFIYFNLRGGR